MQERFCKLLSKVLKLWKRFNQKEKVEKDSNPRKGFRMQISKLKRGGKGKGSFQADNVFFLKTINIGAQEILVTDRPKSKFPSNFLTSFTSTKVKLRMRFT